MAPRGRVIAAFLTLYVVWGSTYLAIRYAVETLPPLPMAGMRFLIAGVVLYAITRARGAVAPAPITWRSATIVGTLLMGANAGVAWAELRIPSGVTALLVATVACWMVLIDWARPRGRRPRAGVLLGLLIGLSGVAVLVGPNAFVGGDPIDPLGAGVLMIGTVAWAAGSIYAREAPRPPSPLVMTAQQMFCGGVVLLIISAVTGLWDGFSLSQVSQRSALAFLFLVSIGSLLGFTAYVYLLTVSTPARVSTYAYVNPVVAVFLGWFFANEPVTPRVLLAAAIIIGAVALITTFGGTAKPPSTASDVSTRDAGRDRESTDTQLPVPDAR